MVTPGGKHALPAVWRGIQAALHPERAGDAGARQAIADEARESNDRLVRWASGVAVLLNVLPVALLLRRTQDDPAGAAWGLWTVGASAVLAVLWIAVGAVAWSGRPAAVGRALGDVVTVLALLGAAARSGNAQRFHPNITVFLCAAFATAWFFRARLRVFAPALLGAAALVMGAMVRFRADDPARLADELMLFAVTALALLGFVVARSLRVGAILAQRQVERVNAELELRIEAQARDIGERGRVEEALREAMVGADAANRAKTAFLANMSHELRTPLNAVLGYTQLLQRSAGMTAEQEAHLAVIGRSGDRLLDLLNDVLDMSRLEAGTHRLEHHRVDLRRLLDDLDRTFRQRAGEKHLSFERREGPGVPPRIVGDERRLRRVLESLLDNAIKFTARGGVVMRVLVAEAADRGDRGPGDARLTVEVEDTGPGIEAGDVAGLFRPFGQLQAGIDAHGGAGLGLALSRELARLMGGDLTVESRAAVGSTFRLEIPLAIADGPLSLGAGQRGELPVAELARPADDVLRDHAATLPAALVAQISAAVLIADYEGLVALLGAFPAERAAVAAALRTLVEQYRYDDIAAALRAGSGVTPPRSTR